MAQNHPAGDPNIKDKYYELILAVERKHRGETRHETALRYIKEAEKGNNSIAYVEGGE